MLKIFWPNYLCFHNYIEGPGKENDIHEEYDSIYLKKKLINQLSENNLVYGDYWFKKSLIKFFKNYIKENNFIEIDLYSPIFNFLLNQKNFLSRFIIQIPLYRFKDFNSSKLDLIKSDFINNLNKIKKSDINYSLACIDINDIDYLKHLKIDKNSIINLKLYLLNINDNGASYNLQNKFHESFPNLTNLTIIIKNRYFYTANITNISDLKIEENDNSKIKNIKIEFDGDYLSDMNQLYLYCQSFKTLESIDLNLKCIDTALKIFFNKSNIIFPSLYKFHFSSIFTVSKEDFILIYNNIDNMPNLKDIKLEFGRYISKKEEDKKLYFDIYNNLIRKVLYKKSIKIINISLFGYPDFYTKNELKELFPLININDFYEVNIEKIEKRGIFCSLI